MPKPAKTLSWVAISSKTNTALSAAPQALREKVKIYRVSQSTRSMHMYTANTKLAKISFWTGCVVLEPCEGAETYVNGKRVTGLIVLRSGTFGGFVSFSHNEKKKKITSRVSTFLSHIRGLAWTFQETVSSWGKATCSALMTRSRLAWSESGPRVLRRQQNLSTGPSLRGSCWRSKASTWSRRWSRGVWKDLLSHSSTITLR